MRVRHSVSKAMWEEAIVRSGEVESLREGTRVGESRLRRRRSEFVSHDDVITEVRKEVKVWCEIGETAGNREDVNVMHVDGDIVDGGCNGEDYKKNPLDERIRGCCSLNTLHYPNTPFQDLNSLYRFLNILQTVILLGVRFQIPFITFHQPHSYKGRIYTRLIF